MLLEFSFCPHFWQFHYNVSQKRRLLWIKIMKQFIQFISLAVEVPLQVWEVFIISLNKLSAHFSLLLMEKKLVFLILVFILSYRSWSLSWFFFILFPLFSSVLSQSSYPLTQWICLLLTLSSDVFYCIIYSIHWIFHLNNMFCSFL